MKKRKKSPKFLEYKQTTKRANFTDELYLRAKDSSPMQINQHLKKKKKRGGGAKITNKIYDGVDEF